VRLLILTAVFAIAAPARAGGDDAMKKACEAAEPSCDPVELLSRLERRAVDRAMRPRGLEFDHAPYGKRIGRIHVVGHDVFGDGDGFLRIFNFFHATSRRSAVTKELVFAAGDVWDQHEIDESARHLRDPVSTSVVAIVPIQSGTEGVVDVLVVTRDVWSLRANSLYEFQSGDDGTKITKLSVSLSENNLLGHRKLLAASFRMDQGAFSIGPLFIDKNMFGKHITLRGRAGPVFNRYSQALEGSESTFQLARPIWSLDTAWGAGVEWSHSVGIERRFQGLDVALYDPEETPEMEMIRKEYHLRKYGLAASVTRGFGERVEHRARGGYRLSVTRPSLMEDFSATGLARELFISEIMPRSERTSELFVGWEMFEPRYRGFHDVSSFELAEDTRLGAEADVTLGTGLSWIGSEANFLRLTGAVGYTGTWRGDGLWRASIAATTRIERVDGEVQAIDRIAEAQLRVVTPVIGPGRFVSEMTLSGIYNDTQNLSYTLGGENGLRGYPIDALEGDELDRRFLWQTELRTRPVSILFTRVGIVYFLDVGGANPTFKDMAMHYDAGVAVRTLVPQLDANVYRFDVAVGLDREQFGHIRFTAGYEQWF
jgi:hypothetical protein